MLDKKGDSRLVKSNINMKKIYLVLILFASLLQSCNSDDCGECFTPPQSFVFELVDAEIGGNLFTTDMYNPEDISVINTIDNTERAFQFISENQLNVNRNCKP